MPASAEIAPGRLIVATPDLGDPNFGGTVVLVLEHTGDGSLGIVLNRPSTLDVVEAMAGGPGDGATRWADLTSDPGVVFVGGPVQPNAIIALARARVVVDETRWQPVFADVGVVRLGDGAFPLQGPLGAMRIFAGYAGWSAGQLDAEVRTGSWFVIDPRATDPFVARPERLWGAVLRRQGGMFATATPNPALN